MKSKYHGLIKQQVSYTGDTASFSVSRYEIIVFTIDGMYSVENKISQIIYSRTV